MTIADPADPDIEQLRLLVDAARADPLADTDPQIPKIMLRLFDDRFYTINTMAEALQALTGVDDLELLREIWLNSTVDAMEEAGGRTPD